MGPFHLLGPMKLVIELPAISNIFEFVLLVLATDCVLVLWLQGSIFAGIRSKLETWKDLEKPPKPPMIDFAVDWFKVSFQRKLGELMTCPICLPPYVAVALFLVRMFLPYGQESLYILAAIGAASRIYRLSK